MKEVYITIYTKEKGKLEFTEEEWNCFDIKTVSLHREEGSAVVYSDKDKEYDQNKSQQSVGRKCCYYCLAVDVKPKEQTGDGFDVCPYCSIDSISIFDSYKELYARHVSDFHFGFKYGNQQEIVIPCGHKDCKLWDQLFKQIESREWQTKKEI